MATVSIKLAIRTRHDRGTKSVLIPFYNFGPLFFQLGLLILMLQLAILKPRQLPWWSPLVLLGGFLLLGFDIDLLIPGAILIGLAFMPL